MERVTGRLKKFRYLQTTVSIQQIDLLQNVITVLINSGIETVQICRRKKFRKQGIPDWNCTRKETVGIDNLIRFRNGNRNILKI